MKAEGPPKKLRKVAAKTKNGGKDEPSMTGKLTPEKVVAKAAAKKKGKGKHKKIKELFDLDNKDSPDSAGSGKGAGNDQMLTLF